MRQNLTEALVKKYPAIYPPNFHFECGDGWFNILTDLSFKINLHFMHYLAWGPERPQALQVKEKFGGLRFYYTLGSVNYESLNPYNTEKLEIALEEITRAIDQAEAEAWKTCERCGARGTAQTIRGWTFTRCDRCRQEEEEQRLRRAGSPL